MESLAQLFPPRIAATIRSQSVSWLHSYQAHVLQMAASCGVADAAAQILDGLLSALNPDPPSSCLSVDVVVPFCTTDAQYLVQCLRGLDAQKHVTVTAHVCGDGCEWPELPAFRRLQLRRYNTPGEWGPYRIANGIVAGENCRSEFLAIQDADDISHPDRLWRQLVSLMTSGAEMISSRTENFVTPEQSDSKILHARRSREPYVPHAPCDCRCLSD